MNRPLALVDFGWLVNVVNPACIKGFAMSELARNKTDRADASAAHISCNQHESAWQLLGPCSGRILLQQPKKGTHPETYL